MSDALIDRLKSLSGGDDCLIRLALVEIESLRQQVYDLNRLCEFDNKTNEQLLQIAADHLSGFVLCDNPPVAWTHSCNVICLDNVELWIDRCPHCGKPAPKGIK